MDRVISTSIPGAPAARSPRAFIMLASAGFVLTGVVTTFLGPILPLLAARWELSDSRSGYFFATQFFASTIGVGLSSFLLPRRGFRFSLGLAYLLMAAGVEGLASAHWKFALLGTAVFGLGLGLVLPATNLLISRANQRRRASALSILNFCWGLGAVSTPFALSLAERQNHVSLFLALLSGLLLLCAVSLASTWEGKLPLDEKNEQQAATQGQRSFGWPVVTMIGGMFFLYVAVETSVGGWITTLAERAPSSAGHSWALAPSLFWGGLLAGRGVAPLVLMRVRERNVVLASLTVAGLGMCVLVVASRRQWITAAGLIIGLGLAAVYPITVALLSRFQEMEKRIAGPMFALAGLGGAVMPWLVGAISTLSGSLQAGLMAPLIATGVLLWLHAVGNHGSQPEQVTGDAVPPV